MSLDFNVSAIADYANVTTAPTHEGMPERWHPVTDGLVWASIACGYCEITEKNLDEVWERVRMWQKVIGAFQSGNQGDVPTTKEDVRRHIGLRTNASRKTKKEFWETVKRHLAEQDKKARPAMDRIGWKGHPGTND